MVGGRDQVTNVRCRKKVVIRPLKVGQASEGSWRDDGGAGGGWKPGEETGWREIGVQGRPNGWGQL